MKVKQKWKVLLVEDDANLAFVISDNLGENGFEVKVASDGNLAWEKFNKEDFDLCLLDVMLPGKDGFALASQIRERNQNVPILFITARGMDEDRLKGFRIGGDDYITKPFNIQELIMRVEVFLKRGISGSGQSKTNTESFVFKGITFEPADLSLSVNGERRRLTQLECDLLSMLCSNQNVLLRREEILKELWGDDDYFKGRSLDVFISKLRKYLKSAPEVGIQNYHGIGFKLITKPPADI